MKLGDYISKTVGYSGAVAGYLLHSSRAFAQPVSVMIEPTNRCNLRCPLCAAGSGMLTRPTGFMTPDSFQNIMEKLPSSIRTVYLWGQGEPFLAPGFLDMARYASESGRRSIVSTNGHFLDNPTDIISSGLGELIVSLDGADSVSYETYRVGGDFKRVTEGVKALADEKKLQGRGPIIILQHLVTRANESALDRFRSLGKHIGADRIVFKTLQAAFSEEGEKYLPVNERYSRYRRLSDGRLVPKAIPVLANRCLRLYHSFQVDWQGNAVPCCFDKNSDVILGNLLEEPWESIWNGERYRSFRRSMNSRGRTLSMCRDCTEGLRGITIDD